MRKFLYNVKNKESKTFQSYIMAESISDAVVKLEKKGYTVLEIKETTDEKPSSFNDDNIYNLRISEFSLQEKKEFFNSFYHLYNSGVPVSEAIKLIINASSDKNVRDFCRLIIKRTEKGKSLKEALKNHSQYLGLAYTMLITAGEEAGKLPETIEGILKNIRIQEEIKSNLISALTYPCAILCLALAVALLFKFFILKVFANMASGIESSDIKALLVSAVIKIILVFAVLGFCVFNIYKNKKLLLEIKGFISKTFLLKNIMNNFYFANFFNVMALAYDAGVPISETLVLASSVVNVGHYQKKLKKASDMIKNGCNITTALASTDLFSNYAISQVSTGEQSGELDKMFKITANDYEQKLDNEIKVLMKLIEPALIVIVGFIAAIIAVKGYSAYYNGILSMF